MMCTETPSIALIGPGAIGTTIVAALHEAGRTPLVCGRTPKETLELRLNDGGYISIPGPVITDPKVVGSPFDLVFVAVKATQNEAIAPWLSVLCDKSTVVCVLQNGVEQQRQLSPFVLGGTVVPSIVWFPAQVEPDGSVWLRQNARLTLPESAGTSIIVDALSGTRCSVTVSKDYAALAWRKLLQNAAAGLMVLTMRRRGIYSREDFAELTRGYLKECAAVARAEGVHLSDGVPEEVFNGFLSTPPDLGSSILSDKLANRPLEWDTRNGVIQRLGRVHGVPTPISDVIVPLLAASSDGPG